MASRVRFVSRKRLLRGDPDQEAVIWYMEHVHLCLLLAVLIH